MATLPDVYTDMTDAGGGSVHNKADRRRMLKRVYGDAWWVDRDRIDAEAAALARKDPAQAERFFFNRISVSADKWMDVKVWDERGRPDEKVASGEMITLGFDGSLGGSDEKRVPDSTVLRGCRIRDNHRFTVGIWEAPGPIWEPPRHLVDQAVERAFELFDVVLFYADPQWWQPDIGRWHERHPDRHGKPVVIEWWTNIDVKMAKALERLQTEIIHDQLTHDDSAAVSEHYKNATKLIKRAQSGDPDGRRERILVRKPHYNSPLKIDAVVTDALAGEARADAIEKGLHELTADEPGTFYAY